MRCFVLSSCLAVVVVTGSALADSATTNRLPDVVVTATRVPTTVETTPILISVITRDQLADQQLDSVAEALRDQAGIAVARTGQPGGPVSVFLRGANSDNTLVLVDGIRVNNGFNNMFDFANLPADNIEHIEVLRGPQSTLYGSEALGGVINIVTRQQVDRCTGAATVEGGSYDSLRTHLELAVPVKTDRFGTVTLVGDGGWFTTDNARSNSFDNAANGSGRITWALSDQFRATLLGTYFTSQAGSPNDRFNNDPNDWLHDETSLIGLTLDGRPLDWWNMKLVLARNHDRMFFDSPDNPPGSNTLGDYSDQTTVTRNQIDFQNVFTITEQHRFLIGGAYDDTSADDQALFTFFGTTSTNTINHPIRDQALYGQYEFTPVPRLTWTAGGRLDDYNTFGTHATYRTGLRWTTPGTETAPMSAVASVRRQCATCSIHPRTVATRTSSPRKVSAGILVSNNRCSTASSTSVRPTSKMSSTTFSAVCRPPTSSSTSPVPARSASSRSSRGRP